MESVMDIIHVVGFLVMNYLYAFRSLEQLSAIYFVNRMRE